MSSNQSFLALRLEGPLQSWGFDSQYSRRNTGLFPTKSAIAGMCCAALGYSRGSEDEIKFLEDFRNLRMTAISIPRKIKHAYRDNEFKELEVRRLQDYHTVQNTKQADGKIKDCHLTHRQYLTDSSFGVLLEGNSSLLEIIGNGLKNPVWGLWLGRKNCIPAAPVCIGVYPIRNEALNKLLNNQPLEKFTHQVEVDSFVDGKDSLPDQPVSFDISKRIYSPRRVTKVEAKT